MIKNYDINYENCIILIITAEVKTNFLITSTSSSTLPFGHAEGGMRLQECRLCAYTLTNQLPKSLFTNESSKGDISDAIVI